MLIKDKTNKNFDFETKVITSKPKTSKENTLVNINPKSI